MNIYYLDASVWLKRYYQEPGSEWINNLFLTDALRACAGLGLVEVYATLARKHKAEQLTSESLAKFVQEVELDWENFARIRFDDAVLSQAKEAAQKFALRGADAIHLASALVMHKSLIAPSDHFIFVTSDQELKMAGEAAGLETFDPALEQTPQSKPKNDE